MSMKEIHMPMMEYQRDVSGNYLILREYADDYRVHMLEHNRIHGLLRVSLNENDCHQDMHYDIGSLENLKSVFSAKRLNGEGVSRIISDIFRTVQELGAYMLNKDDILLDPEYMYMDENDNLMLCYVPNNGTGIGTGLSELLRSMLAAVDNNDHDSVVLTYTLYQESMRENYVIDDLMKIIRSAGKRKQDKKNLREEPMRESAYEPAYESADEPAYVPAHQPSYEPVSYYQTMEKASGSQLKVAEPEEESFQGISRKKIGRGIIKGRKLFRMG
jgi:hypothetical protein